MDWLVFASGVIAGGAIMYYIQPAVKDAVAKMFGWEAQVAQAYRDRAKTLTAKTK